MALRARYSEPEPVVETPAEEFGEVQTNAGEPPTIEPTEPPALPPDDPEPQAEILPPPSEPASLTLPPNYKHIPVPDPPAIAETLQRARALRPLLRRVPVGVPQVLDEEATIERIAETRVWQPVLRPRQELWLEVALVFDLSPSMSLWGRFRKDLQRFLSRYGEFRDLRVWRLVYDASGRASLQAQNGSRRSPRELLTGDRRRLVVVVSDCVAPAWHDGQMRELLAIWTEKLPAVILQVFPERLWSRTALARAIAVELQGRQAGLPSNGLRPVARSYWDRQKVNPNQRPETQIYVPVVTVEPDSLANLARVVAGDRRARVAGVAWDEQAVSSQPRAAQPASEPSKSQLGDRVERFLQTASPMARELAGLLAAAPAITLPIVRLIQRSLLPRSSAVQVAEVFMSGLLKVSSRTTPTIENAEKLAYQVVDEETRSRLLQDLPALDGVIVIEEVSRHIAKGLGKSLDTFRALLRSPTATAELTAETEFLRAFATVTATVLRGLGSEFAAIADQFAPPPTSETAPEIADLLALEDREYEVAEIRSFPLLQDFEYETVEIEAVLERFEFETATIARETVEKESWLGLRRETAEEWVIQRRRAAAWGYTEALSDNANLEMVAIPAGSFQMGAPESEPESADSERPQHEVAVQRFYLGRYPVTQAQWRIVAGYPLVERELNSDPSDFKGDNRPVEQVSWDDAVEFCQRLSARTGREYRLPSEAEWEYACRAGTATPFHLGETITTDLANYYGDYIYNGGPKGDSRKETTEVGQFPANAWGLHDLHGNVWEWCEDDWHSSYQGAPTDGSAWVERDRSETRRLLRGGSWGDYPEDCRSAIRFNLTRADADYFIGFRVACVPARTLLGP